MYFKKKNGFTIIELLMVISIISLLSTVIFNFTNETRAKARDSVRLSDMKQIGTAMQMYYQDTGKIPTSFEDLTNGPNPYLPSIPLDPSTRLPYNFASTTDTVVVSAFYENQYIDATKKKSVGVAIGDTDISTLCGEGFVYPNCSGDGSPLDQIVFISSGVTYGGGGGGTSSPTPPPVIPAPSISLSVSSSTVMSTNRVILSWISLNTTSCTAIGGSTGWAGDKDATVGAHTWTSDILTAGTYIYNISCSNTRGIATSSIVVNSLGISDCSISNINLQCSVSAPLGCYCGGGMKDSNSSDYRIWKVSDQGNLTWSNAVSSCSSISPSGVWRLPLSNELYRIMITETVARKLGLSPYKNLYGVDIYYQYWSGDYRGGDEANLGAVRKYRTDRWYWVWSINSEWKNNSNFTRCICSTNNCTSNL
jgi:prepilin-type N-terminal cleavage/methylation domain-containing protein